MKLWLPTIVIVGAFAAIWFGAAWLRTWLARRAHFNWNRIAEARELGKRTAEADDTPVIEGSIDGFELLVHPVSQERRTHGARLPFWRRHETTFELELDDAIPSSLELETRSGPGPVLVSTSERDALGLETGGVEHRDVGQFFQLPEGDAADRIRNHELGERLIELAAVADEVELADGQMTVEIDRYVRDAETLDDALQHVVDTGRALRDAFGEDERASETDGHHW